MKVEIPGLRPDHVLVIDTDDFDTACLSTVAEEVGVADWIEREAGAHTVTIRLNNGAGWRWEPVVSA